MSILDTMLRQVAVYWQQDGLNVEGDFTYKDAVEIKCRWTDVIENFIGPNGDQQVSRSKVYVDRDMKPGDLLMLGALPSGGLTGDDPRGDNAGVWEVLSFGKLRKLKQDKFLRTVYL